MPDLNWRLFIHQDNFIELQRLKNPEIYFTVTWDKSLLKLYAQVPITINHEQTTHLAIMYA